MRGLMLMRGRLQMLGFMGNAWVSQHRHLDWYLRLDAHKKGSWQAELYQVPSPIFVCLS